jgi:hypothetical protein
MLHIVHMIERRHPEKAGTITRALVLASASGLLIGLGLLVA